MSRKRRRRRGSGGSRFLCVKKQCFCGRKSIYTGNLGLHGKINWRNPCIYNKEYLYQNPLRYFPRREIKGNGNAGLPISSVLIFITFFIKMRVKLTTSANCCLLSDLTKIIFDQDVIDSIKWRMFRCTGRDGRKVHRGGIR